MTPNNDFQTYLAATEADLMQFTKADLSEEAAKLQISGRSSMSKVVLAQSIARKWAKIEFPAPILLKQA